ncbi:MAG: hypothetical protein EAX90_08230 [Candidatus Heimdallarchaeota archaeon]|nr:hypothetical protein [Candidatus Heimdallarchaeota archaeon]
MFENETSKIEKLISENLKQIETERSTEEKQILRKLQYFQEGYLLRDITRVENWVKELMDEEVQIIGTNSVFPGEFEWRSGYKAAYELFENDWKNWGSVKFYLENAEISIDNETAWVMIFATVTRDTTKEKNRTFEASKLRSLSRIKEICDKNLPSSRALYEIINDASSVLVQYERSEIFVWPIRITLGFLKKKNNWLIKQIHFSWPGRGFQAVRFLSD